VCDVETEGMRNITVKSGQHLVHFFITNLYGVAGASSVLSFHDHLEEMRESAGRTESGVRRCGAGRSGLCAGNGRWSRVRTIVSTSRA
jgi:hypothetical protein